VFYIRRQDLSFHEIFSEDSLRSIGIYKTTSLAAQRKVINYF